MSKERKFKKLSGSDVVRIFERLGFYVVSQKGSHIKVRRILPNGERQTLGFPNHKTIAPGTLKAIYNQAYYFVNKDDLDRFFRVGS